MASYVVLERRPATGSRPETVFVRDDFALLALVFPLLWLLWHRLWFAALMLLLVSAVIGMAGEYLAPGAAVFFAGLAVSLFVALEGPAWRIARHRRAGFSAAGTVVARNLDAAEIRWFTGRARPTFAVTAPPRGHAAPPPLPPNESDMLFGFGSGAGG